MLALTSIDLLSLQSSLRIRKDKYNLTQVFDPIRKKYLVVTPEEMVRQLWIVYLTEIRKLNPKLIAVERRFMLNGLEKRFDMVVYSNATDPLMLMEFKAPGIPLTQSVFDQIAHYNMELNVPYALVSNGLHHYCFRIDDISKRFIWEEKLPMA